MEQANSNHVLEVYLNPIIRLSKSSGLTIRELSVMMLTCSPSLLVRDRGCGRPAESELDSPDLGHLSWMIEFALYLAMTLRGTGEG